MANNIIVVVDGGVVTSVWTSNKSKAEVEIVDLDNLSEEHFRNKAIDIAEKRTKGMRHQY